MTVIVFLIDNSASMNQRTYLGTTLLDVAKGCVETFQKIRLKNSRVDRYFLLTLDREPYHIKLAGWKQNAQQLNSALDSIKADGLTSLGSGLRRTFDMLNLNRMQLGLENYAMGRYPSQFEPAIVICITDGKRLTTEDGIVTGGLTLPMYEQGIPGHLYTSEPFRWDYRLYGLILRLPAVQDPHFETPKFIPTDIDCPVHSICEETGGRAYKVMNHKMLSQCLDSLAQKCQPGVMVHFMKIPDPNQVESLPAKWHNCRKMIYVKLLARVGSAHSAWPIPESFWPDLSTLKELLPSRTAHPLLYFSVEKHRMPKILENFPFDKYELEPSPLTQHILEKRDSTFVWQCYLPRSGKDRDYPFAYLKASSDLSTVNLTVLPYNYPYFLDLLVELAEKHKMRLNESWGSKFAEYLGQTPSYYFPPLTKAFEKLGFQKVIKPEAVDQVIPYNLKHHFQKLRHAAKIEYERLLQQCENKSKPEDTIKVVPSVSLVQRSDFNKVMSDFGDNLVGVSAAQHHQKQHGALDILPVSLARSSQIAAPRSYADARLIPRHQLRQMLPKMRTNLRAVLANRDRPMDRETINHQSMAEMGNYSNYKFSQPLSPPLREINPAPQRVDTFGNPFRRKSTAFVADEGFVDEFVGISGTSSPEHAGGGSRRNSSVNSVTNQQNRVKGALPCDFTYEKWKESPSQSPRTISDASDSLELLIDGMDVDGEAVQTGRTPNGFTSGSGHPQSPGSPKSPTLKMSGKTKTAKQSFAANCDIVESITRQSREPLIDGKFIFDKLSNLKGSFKQRLAALLVIIVEAQRYKRPRLVRLLKDYRTNMQEERKQMRADHLSGTVRAKENNGRS